MAVNDLVLYEPAGEGYTGDFAYAVAAQSSLTPFINPGEPILKALGATPYVTKIAASTATKPVVGTDYLAGVSSGISSETATVDGTVTVTKMTNNQTYLIAPLVAATYGVGATPVQATYDALIGSRVLINNSSAVSGVTTYTLLAADGSTNGLVVMPLDVQKYPGKVRVAFRGGLNYLS